MSLSLVKIESVLYKKDGSGVTIDSVENYDRSFNFEGWYFLPIFFHLNKGNFQTSASTVKDFYEAFSITDTEGLAGTYLSGILGKDILSGDYNNSAQSSYTPMSFGGLYTNFSFEILALMARDKFFKDIAFPNFDSDVTIETGGFEACLDFLCLHEDFFKR